MGKRIVIALGGNALGSNLPEQMVAVKKTASAIVDLIEAGNEVVIAHGNGPQVGMIQNAMSELTRSNPAKYIPCPLSVCVAMSQGYIGYDLQNAIRTELMNRGVYRTVSTLLTQVIVDPYDEAFYKPSKIIGRVMTEEEAEEEEKKGNHVVRTEEGYRRIVAAPMPHQIVELDAVNTLMDADQVVIAAGGGGIPVLEQGTVLKGASAVIEKDLIAGLLADGVEADMLIILTGEESVYKNYGTDKQESIREMTCAEARRYIAEGEFGEGTMLPKIETAISYIGDYATRSVLITKLGSIEAAMAGQTGTIIKK